MSRSSFHRILCWVFGHRLRKVRELNIGGELCECIACGVELCVHHGRQQVIPYDDEVQKFERQITELCAKYRRSEHV